MKRTRTALLTTTALAFAAGSAAAEVSLSGSAEMGIAGSKDDSTRFHTDVNVSFSMSGETDGGITFSTKVDLDDNDDSFADDAAGNIAVAIGGPFGNLTMGDTDGAFDWALTEVFIGGSLRDEHTDHMGKAPSGNAGLDGTHDGQILRYDNSIGDFGVALSAELDDEIDGSDGEGKTVFGFGAKYSMAMPGDGSVGFGFGYQRGDTKQGLGLLSSDTMNFSLTAIGASANVSTGNGFQAIVNWSKADTDGSSLERLPTDNPGRSVTQMGNASLTHVSFGVGYTTGPVTIGANWGQNKTDASFDRSVDWDDDTAGTDMQTNSVGEIKATGFGFSATYDLGGGASLQLGIGNDTTDTTVPDDGDTTDMNDDPDVTSVDGNAWSLGLAFSF